MNEGVGDTGVALFDLDRTLLDCNSGRLWLTAEWRAGRLGLRDLTWASWWLLRYSLGQAGMEDEFRNAVAHLAGLEEDVLDERTRRWFAAEVRHRVRPGALQALRTHRTAGDRLVIATSGSIYAARAAQQAYGLDDSVASRFEVVEGRFTGLVSDIAYGPHKADRVAEWAQAEGVDLDRASFYTDSATDLALLERVGRPVAVNPDRRLDKLARARGWEVVDWGRSR